MKSSLKKSLYLGLAAVSFVAVAGTTSANASAKSYATASAYSTLTAPSTSRNVNLTGANAVYTKPGTVKGAKTVLTTTTAKKLNASNRGQANFRAYGVKTTNRGSVYYKVVSFDGTYRGYVYGGKSKTAFANGLVSYDTTKDATAPSSTTSFNLNADTSSTANTLFFKAPSYTQYKVGRARVNGNILASSDAYKGASFTFDKAVTTSREGDTWYEIASTKLSNGTTTSELNGAWIKASNVKNPNADPAATNDNSIKIVYRTADGNTVAGADKTFVNASKSNTTAGTAYGNETNGAGTQLMPYAQANVPTGYVFSGYLQGQNPQYGGTLYVTVAQGATSKASLAVQTTVNGSTVENGLSKGDLFNTPKLTSTTAQLLTGPKDQTFGQSQNAGNLDKLVNNLAWGTDTTGNQGNLIKYYAKAPISSSNSDHQAYTVNVSATKAANQNTNYGDTFKIVFDENGTINSTDFGNLSNPDTSNSDFFN
ncbi:hypothetical protein [Secundilactobacillus silagei]|uniref:hypothetical protein n=1 Tax=Secundilactobacillus silagei TaxID=1293415 RepID=UPI0006D0AFEE|nr:hypothetical protein [Secundilactobacillus silagei]